MHTITLLVAAALVVVGCGSSGDAGSADFTATLEHTFDPIPVESGAEEYWCQSWTIGNDETLYVNKVRQVNGGGWHHSNWSFVPENMFGEDGTWKCNDRDWDQVVAAVAGGFIFAQSTQALEEVQAFPEGAVIVVPPRSKIVGTVHLFNVAASPIDSSLTMGFQTIEEEEIEIELRELNFANFTIAIPELRQSRWAQTCDIGEYVGESFNIYYVLGHYHQWGNYFKLSFVDDDGSERTIVEFDNSPGDTLGVTIDPPINSEGAARLKYVCGFNNTTDHVLHWGNNAQEEMCQFLAYTDADNKIAAYPAGNVPELMGETEDGVLMYDTACEGGLIIGFPGQN
jgi:hypothetical protein